MVENEPMTIFCDNSELSFLGPGIPLYFGFLKACMLFFIVASVIYTTYGMIMNARGNECKEFKKGEKVEDN